MLRIILRFDLDSVCNSEIGEAYGMSFRVCNLFVDRFCGEEGKLLKLLDRFVLLHINIIIYQVYKSPRYAILISLYSKTNSRSNHYFYLMPAICVCRDLSFLWPTIRQNIKKNGF